MRWFDMAASFLRILKANGLLYLSPGLEQPWDMRQTHTAATSNPNGVASIRRIAQSFVMSQSIARVLIHTVFSTKSREPAFHDATFRSEVHAYLGGCAKALDCLPLKIGGVADHVHLLTTLSRTIAIADLVKEIKRVSTNWIQKRDGMFRQFHWQAGYGCFSVSESKAAAVVRYIEQQEEHHRKITFQDEYRELLRRHGQTWDEAYVWD